MYGTEAQKKPVELLMTCCSS